MSEIESYNFLISDANKLWKGDNQSEISREKQQQIIRQNILIVLELI